MTDVTYYVALPFMQDDTGAPVAGAAEECHSPSFALRRAEVLAKAAGSVGAGRLQPHRRSDDRRIQPREITEKIRRRARRSERALRIRSSSPLMPPRRLAGSRRHRNSRKKARTSPASNSGCSSAAKCPPLGMMLQRRMSVNTRAAAVRGGLRISRGNCA